MNKFKPMIYLLFFLSLTLSCDQKKTDNGDVLVAETSSTNLSLNMTKDTLIYTSGIRSILHDRKGNYWFGSHQEGVCLFDGKAFTYFTVEDGLSNNQVRTIQEDDNGTIWFGTANGVSSYNGEKITNHTLIVDDASQNEWKKTDNDLWFNAGNNAGVYRFDGQKLKYLAFLNLKIINPDNVYFVTSLARGKNDMLWIGTFAGVFGYSGNEFTIINDETLELKLETGQLHIRSLLEDSKGNLWIGNNGIGVLLHNGDSIINFSDKQGLIHPNSSGKGDPSPAGTLEHVFAIEEDSQGNIWFSDRDNGAWKFDGNEMTNYIIGNKLKTQMIWTIYEDRNENLLFAMADGGIYKFNGKSFDKKF